jgi:hypothetical protein
MEGEGFRISDALKGACLHLYEVWLVLEQGHGLWACDTEQVAHATCTRPANVRAKCDQG